MKKLFLIFILTFLSAHSQIVLTIQSEKDEYNWGEEMTFICKLTNVTDTTVSFMSSNWNSCQVQFLLNEFNSIDYFICFPTYQEIIIPPNSSRQYTWQIDPYVYGIPSIEGEQKLVGYYSHNKLGYLTDTTYFNAPHFRGGQIYLSCYYGTEEKVDSIRNYYGIELVQHGEYPNSFYEIWQIVDMEVTVALSIFEKSGIFGAMELHRPPILYSSVGLTSVEGDEEIENNFSLSQNYPNPFNPTTKIKFTIGTPPVSSPLAKGRTKEGIVTLKVFDILGREVKTLLNKQMQPGTHEVTFNASDLPCGVYFYRLTNGNYSATKKMLLMK